MSAAMKACPFCGAQLYAGLVDAIVNPSKDESCPMQKPLAARERLESVRAALPLATLMMLGRSWAA